MQSESLITPDHTWLAEVEKSSGVVVSACYQCKKCSAGCPVTFAMDYLPNQILHMIQMGLKDEVLKSTTIWVCASCETCTTRCPNDIDVAKIIDTLRITAKNSGVKLGQNRPPIFHSSVLQSIKTTGRLYELGMIGLFMLRTSGDLISNIKSGALMEDMKVGMKLFRHGKLKLFPSFTKRRRDIKRSFKKLKRGEVA